MDRTERATSPAYAPGSFVRKAKGREPAGCLRAQEGSLSWKCPCLHLRTLLCRVFLLCFVVLHRPDVNCCKSCKPSIPACCSFLTLVVRFARLHRLSEEYVQTTSHTRTYLHTDAQAHTRAHTHRDMCVTYHFLCFRVICGRTVDNVPSIQCVTDSSSPLSSVLGYRGVSTLSSRVCGPELCIHCSPSVYKAVCL